MFVLSCKLSSTMKGALATWQAVGYLRCGLFLVCRRSAAPQPRTRWLQRRSSKLQLLPQWWPLQRQSLHQQSQQWQQRLSPHQQLSHLQRWVEDTETDRAAGTGRERFSGQDGSVMTAGAVLLLLTMCISCMWHHCWRHLRNCFSCPLSHLQPATWYDESGYCWCDMPDGWRYWWDATTQQWQQHSETPAGEGPAAHQPAQAATAAEAPSAAAAVAPAEPGFQQQAQEQQQQQADATTASDWADSFGMAAEVQQPQAPAAQPLPAADWADSFGLSAEQQQQQQPQALPAQPVPAVDLADSFGLVPAAQHMPPDVSPEPEAPAAPPLPLAPPPAASWHQPQQPQPWQPSPSPEPLGAGPPAPQHQPWQPSPSPDAVSEQPVGQPSWQASASPDAAPPPHKQHKQPWGQPPLAPAPAVWRPSPSPSPDQLAPADPAAHQWSQGTAAAGTGMQQPATFQPYAAQPQQPAAPFVPAAAAVPSVAPAVLGHAGYGVAQPGYGSAGGAAAGYSQHGRPAAPFGKLLFGGRVLLAAPSGKFCARV